MTDSPDGEVCLEFSGIVTLSVQKDRRIGLSFLEETFSASLQNVEHLEHIIIAFVRLGTSPDALHKFMNLVERMFDFGIQWKELEKVTSEMPCKIYYEMVDGVEFGLKYDDNDEYIVPNEDDAHLTKVYNDCKEQEARFEKLKGIISKIREEGFVQDMSATTIQSTFRGWQARMMYRWNVHNSFGKYLVLKDFAELIMC